MQSSGDMLRPRASSSLREPHGGGPCRFRPALSQGPPGGCDAAARCGTLATVWRRVRPCFHQDVTKQFGKRQTEPLVQLRAGVYRHAEACAAGLVAIHRKNKGAFTPCLVVGINVGTLREYVILDRDCVQPARAHR